MDIGLLAAFVGGMLALLSPCGALLLPSFFASTVGARGMLAVHAAVFYLGLLATLVPVGVGVSALAGTVAHHRTAIVAVAAVLIVGLGVLQLLGGGFDLTRLMPGFGRLQDQTLRRRGVAKTFVLGAVSGVAGFCTGPILGAVLTMASSRGAFSAGILLCVYALGMVAPLVVLAACWNVIGTRTRTALRGREVSIAGTTVHSTNLITGVLLICLGVAFWFTNGFIDIPEIVDSGTQLSLQNAAAALSNPIVDIVAVIVVAAALIAWWWLRGGRPKPELDDSAN